MINELNSIDKHDNFPCLVFTNPGHLDPRAFRVFGLHGKPDNDSPIGQFGTGLKYAIAILLRTGHTLTIQLREADGSLGKAYDFFAQPGEFRSTATTEIYYTEWTPGQPTHTHPLPFTIDLGKHWELWQAYRELESNCRDESGQTLELHDDEDFLPVLEACYPTTTVIVRGPEILRIHENRDTFFLPCVDIPLPHLTSIGTLYQPRTSTNRLYYKGILAQEYNKPWLNTYNITERLELSEDRTVKYNFEVDNAICRILVQLTDEQAIHDILTAKENYRESELDFGTVKTFAQQHMTTEFRAALDRAIKHSPVSCNSSAKRLLEATNIPTRELPRWTPSDFELQMIERAVEGLTKLGYPVKKYPLVLIEISSELVGKAEDETIYLTRLAFIKTTQYLAATILEEFLHLEHGFRDRTYEFQSFLFDEIIRQGERVLGSPL